MRRIGIVSVTAALVLSGLGAVPQARADAPHEGDFVDLAGNHITIEATTEVSQIARTKPTWNVDSWRPDVGYAKTLLAQCNP
ncbi:Protein of unknown function [Tessaracoccus bendigoensis DSM 12906]|uniref:Uncharacterized protein n=1 Tax=Tessaracoccus bendigoensis DSM 12906 TaxID=1123357 RepID=A0A1M6NIY8_9ACTN|nr:DUF2599 domain-containing protein [Tessaracoccus bendigoensis]SHJ95650.1 Protein of unknown function [Tessaracoccus bendigoensis DSM 12906]